MLSMALLASVIAGSLALMLHLRLDLSYALASDRALELGEATAADLAALLPNRYVTVQGSPMLSRAVRFARTLSGRTYALFPLAGQRQIFVQIPAEALKDPARIARGEFTGRLLTLGQLGPRLHAVRAYLQHTLALPVTSETFVVLAEETPATYGWAVLLCASCLFMAALSAWLLVRWFRPKNSLTTPNRSRL
jgi:hypothetical protein